MGHPQGLSQRELEWETGLKPSQIIAGLAWLEERRRRSITCAKLGEFDPAV
ncbi:hypothetical protein [Streptomyces gilvosporeus]|uniref:hypothetical protein n=1 Tax=Streptomyces gilvosporeus TaxID=553510 RepID=UPI00131ACEBF|nr:hypothetical protein [Streptomyces gilvosporeus]